ncbi:hypothetical protein JB92DRAFT_62627 [Gautieria morchelliformis]|nr:hypothetical protein JB92DRAFT_62627 [Gautieria morchelliformis]
MNVIQNEFGIQGEVCWHSRSLKIILRQEPSDPAVSAQGNSVTNRSETDGSVSHRFRTCVSPAKCPNSGDRSMRSPVCVAPTTATATTTPLVPLATVVVSFYIFDWLPFTDMGLSIPGGHCGLGESPEPQWQPIGSPEPQCRRRTPGRPGNGDARARRWPPTPKTSRGTYAYATPMRRSIRVSSSQCFRYAVVCAPAPARYPLCLYEPSNWGWVRP